MLRSEDEQHKILETVLKKRRTRNKEINQLLALKAAQPKKSGKNAGGSAKFVSAERLVKDYRQKEHDSIRVRRRSKTISDREVEKICAECKVAFVVLIRSPALADKKVRRLLKRLRLFSVFTGVFVSVNTRMAKTLQLVAPFVLYGRPSRKSVRDLLRKRAFARVDKKRIQLSDNQLVEDHLGDKGMLCVEDMVHELTTSGEHFQAVANFLWPFRLSAPTGRFEKYTLQVDEVGKAGFKDKVIDEWIAKLV